MNPGLVKDVMKHRDLINLRSFSSIRPKQKAKNTCSLLKISDKAEMCEVRTICSRNRGSIFSLLDQLNMAVPISGLDGKSRNFSLDCRGQYNNLRVSPQNFHKNSILSLGGAKIAVTSLAKIATNFSTSSCCRHGEAGGEPGTINITFVDKNQKHINVLGRVGESALDLAHRYDIPMEGACEGSLACTTCHCYVEPDHFYDLLPEASEKEEDLLDGAPFLDVNSRLGCQVIVEKELEGVHLRLPRYTRNFYVDGHVPAAH